MISFQATFALSFEPHFLRRCLFVSPISGPCNLSFPSESNFKILPRSFNCNNKPRNGGPVVSCFSDSGTSISTKNSGDPAPPVKKKRKRYRKQYPGESKGISEEMRFVAMRLRNVNDEESSGGDTGGDVNGEADAWQPSMEGFLMYLIDSKLVFNTIERIVDESNDVAYAYFRRTGLERSRGLSMDIEWFSEQKYVIPEPSNPGVSYARYLEELAEKNAPLFLCHFYTIYFSHIAGGQVIARKVSEKLLDKRDLEFYKWDGDVQESLKGVKEKLNMLGEHWSRDEKNKCLRETAKSFRFLGQIVRLIIL